MGRGREWSQQEIEYLHKWAGVRPPKWMGSKLKRSRASVFSKCRKLGLPTVADDDFFTTGDLAKMLDCTPSAINKRIQHGTLKSKRLSNSINYITRAAFRECYLQNSRDKLFKGVDPEIINWLLEK